MKTDLTVAGYIFNQDKLLLIYHKKLALWLPIGGHMEKNETPVDAMKREAREEEGLAIKLLIKPSNYSTGKEIERCAVPFHSDIHTVGDHYHYCQFYICETEDLEVKIDKKKSLAFDWFTEESADTPSLISGNLHQLAFKTYKEMKNDR